METKNEYSIKIEGINFNWTTYSNWTTYRVWKNGQDIDPDNLTIEELEFIQEKLFDYSEMFKEQIKYLEKL